MIEISDKTVNVPDYNSFLTTFGKSLGNAGYKAWFDFNGDNSTNIPDYNAFLVRFGRGYTFS